MDHPKKLVELFQFQIGRFQNLNYFFSNICIETQYVAYLLNIYDVRVEMPVVWIYFMRTQK